MKLRNLLPVAFACLLASSQVSAQTITTIAGNGTAGYSGDGGQATAAQLNDPFQVAVDAAGNVYIADRLNNRIRKINSSGIITTIAGTGTTGYSGDGGLATSAQLNDPTEVAIDAAGNVYIADEGNNRIRKINSSGTITTIAGTGITGYSGDGGPATAAQLNTPTGVAVDAVGNVYIVDEGNNGIRKINGSGIITTIAGTGTQGYSGDGGPASAAQLYGPIGVAVDVAGNLYIADYLNSRIRKIDDLDTITTIAGTDTLGYNGDGGLANAAQLFTPSGVAADTVGNVYIADQGNNRIRKIDGSGTITTIAGTGTIGYSGDGGPATAAKLYAPSGIAIDAAGNVYIADARNNRIRKISFAPSSVSTIKQADIEIAPNPTSGIVYIKAPGKLNYYICSMEGKLVQSGKNATSANIETLADGLYMMTITDADNHVIKVEKISKMRNY